MFTKKLLLIILSVNILTYAAEHKWEKDDNEYRTPTMHSRETLDLDNIVPTIYPDNAAVITNKIVETFKERQVVPIGFPNTSLLTVIEKYDPDQRDPYNFVLFFDKEGRSTQLTHQNQTPLQCGISVRQNWFNTLMPQVSVLYATGDLVSFNQSRSCCQYRWESSFMTNLDSPFAIHGLTSFEGGKNLFHSDTEAIIINNQGEELWKYSVGSPEAITDIVSYGQPFDLKEVALCTSSLSLIKWKKATLWDKVRTCSCNITGRVEIERLERRPYSFVYDNNGELIVNYQTGGEEEEQAN